MDELILRVKNALQAMNLPCKLAFPTERLPMLTAPLYAIRPECETRTSAVLGDYFGLSNGAACYGRAWNAVVCVDFYAPYAIGGTACDEALQRVLAKLSEQLADAGLAEMRLDPLRFDTDTDDLRSTIYLTFRGYLCRTVSD